MIQARELMVGNLFYLNDDDLIENQHVYENIAIHKITGEDIHMCETDNEAFNMFYKPIPITEERLLKFEFEKTKFSETTLILALNDWSEISVNLYNGKCAVELSISRHSFVVEVYYVHQLQNLYFALEQKELERQ
jgi:hypothetical protein